MELAGNQMNPSRARCPTGARCRMATFFELGRMVHAGNFFAKESRSSGRGELRARTQPPRLAVAGQIAFNPLAPSVLFVKEHRGLVPQVDYYHGRRSVTQTNEK